MHKSCQLTNSVFSSLSSKPSFKKSLSPSSITTRASYQNEANISYELQYNHKQSPSKRKPKNQQHSQETYIKKSPGKTKRKMAKTFKTISKRYKTEICRNWQLTGECQFGDKCSFAHGDTELKTKRHVPKNYKTKICKVFMEEMFCPYGKRCQFQHVMLGTRAHELPYSLILAENLRYMSQRVQASTALSNDKMYEVLVAKNAAYENYFSSKQTRLSVFESLAPSEEVNQI